MVAKRVAGTLRKSRANQKSGEQDDGSNDGGSLIFQRLGS